MVQQFIHEEVKNAKVVDSFTHNEAERRFFEVGGFLIKKDEYKNWLPLYFHIDLADTF